MRHLHLRKRLSRGLEPYPARTSWKRFLDVVVYIAGVSGPLFTLPQIFLIFSTHNAAGVSVITWLGWTALDIPWILYGITHRERPVFIAYTLWLIANLTVVIGAVMYG